MERAKNAGAGRIVLAVIVLLLGIGFGALNIVNGVSAYAKIPSNKEIRRMEEYLELMEDLEETLADPEILDNVDIAADLDEKLEDSDLTKSQKREIRELYADTLANAAGDSVDKELAGNSLSREIVYYRQNIPNPEQIRTHTIRGMMIGGASILLSLVIFIALIKPVAAKKK